MSSRRRTGTEEQRLDHLDCRTWRDMLSAKEESAMNALLSEKQQELLADSEGLPEEYYPLLGQMIRSYRDSVLLQPAADSFRRGWKEAQNGDTLPVDRLWEGLDVE